MAGRIGKGFIANLPFIIHIINKGTDTLWSIFRRIADDAAHIGCRQFIKIQESHGFRCTDIPQIIGTDHFPIIHLPYNTADANESLHGSAVIAVAHGRLFPI